MVWICTISYFTTPVLINVWVALHASPVRLTSLINILRHVYFRTDASISKVLDLKLPINGYVYLKLIDKTKLSKIAEQFLCLVNLVESGIHFFQMIAWFSYVY